MGNLASSRRSSRCTSTSAPGDPVDFSSFSILRSIGRGSYGKVCIAQKKDTKQLFAMKYMNKAHCIKAGVVTNILQELRLLRLINHTNIVNLRFAFHDIEDMCLVVDLLQGGDLRYHLGKIERFSEHDVSFYVIQISSALEYLRSIHIIHRDIKPDNLLLNLAGHVHLTDFNVATRLGSATGLAQSESGTWQYMAPEIFHTNAKKSPGYSHAVDWWSLAVTCYELCNGSRPFTVPKSAGTASAFFKSQPNYAKFSCQLSPNFIQLLSKMLELDDTCRVSTQCDVSSILGITSSAIDSGELKPSFIPSMKKLNVDPAYELEEMIIESKPIHKKHARLSKTASMDGAAMKARLSGNNGAILAVIDREFEPFNYLKPCRSHSVPNITLNAVSLDSSGITKDP